MLKPVRILPTKEAQTFDHISDEDFFARFPDVTHRERPWAPVLVVDKGWKIISRRDGLRMRVREHPGTVGWPEIVMLGFEPDDSDLSFQYTPFGITGAARRAR
ncbi:hypothetical protein [Methylobacterium sp. Leaf102]|uniref:hypothetical protein n=1 Tax=Methylobacterium sp. Leaf102 TaxID=1736253 RepID=UPI000A572063|nr:hypothetical protein [Methylobacterium sp. Leaf102]